MSERKRQRWLVVSPGGRGNGWETDGPKHEAPICQGEATNASNKPSHAPITPEPVQRPTFVGERKCGTCGSGWVPTKG